MLKPAILPPQPKIKHQRDQHSRLDRRLSPPSQNRPRFFRSSSITSGRILKHDYVNFYFLIPLGHQLNLVFIGVTLFIFLTLVVRVILSPTLSMVFVGITYSFIWLPQIIRSVRRGRSSGLSKEYVVGTTVCRLFLALCKCPSPSSGCILKKAICRLLNMSEECT